MTRRSFLAIGFLVLLGFDTAGQMGFKLAATRAGMAALEREWFLAVLSSPWVYVAIAAYLGAFVIWMTLLEHAPIGPAFAASHAEIVTVLAFSVWLLHETFTARQVAGACLVFAGITVFAARDRRDAPRERAP
jgi:drug/metabolite transporter (DMT)-like permease